MLFPGNVIVHKSILIFRAQALVLSKQHKTFKRDLKSTGLNPDQMTTYEFFRSNLEYLKVSYFERGLERRISLLRQAIFFRTSKVSFQFITTTTSERRKCLFSSSLLRQTVKTFNVLILPMASKKIRTSKIQNINYLWRITYGYQGLWGVRLGSIRLGQAGFGQVRFHYLKLGQIRLG